MASGAVKGRAGLKPIGMYGFGAGGAAVPMSKRVFDKYDTDKSGKISPAEFKEMVYELGYHLSNVEFDLAIKVLDKDGDKEISYSEFAEWWRTEDRFSKLQLTNEKAAQLKNCSDFFQAFDDDGNGVLDRGEFTKCHESLVNCGITTETFERLLANIDKDGDGHVSFNEYITWLIDQNKLHLAPSTAYLIPHADDTTAGAAKAAPTVSVGPTPAAADVASTPEVSAPASESPSAPASQTPSAPASQTPSAPAAEAPSAVSAFRQKSEFFAQQAAAAAEELRLRRLRRANVAH